MSNENMQLIDTFYIDRTEVSIDQFSEYAMDTGITTEAEKNGGGMVYDDGWRSMPGWTWRTPAGLETDTSLPAVHITFDEAADYCHWAGKRLPTDMEWQRAAYTESRQQPESPFEQGASYPYPTGESPIGANCLNDCGPTIALDFSKVLTRGIGPAPVASSKKGVNGLFDMGANVWEWTELDNASHKGTRGGSWWYGAVPMQRNHKATKPRDMAAIYIGFRCASDN